MAGAGLVLAALGLLPGLLRASLHTTVLALDVAHWFLAGLMPFVVGVGLALAVRRGDPDEVNGRGAALRSVALAAGGSVLAEAVFWVVGIYGGSVVTRWSAGEIYHGHPAAFGVAQAATVVGLGILTGLLMARGQWRGIVKVRRPEPS